MHPAGPVGQLGDFGELGTFRTAAGDLVHCRLDRSGRLVAYLEAGSKLVPCDQRVLLDAVKLSDDPDWLNEDQPFRAPAVAGD